MADLDDSGKTMVFARSIVPGVAHHAEEIGHYLVVVEGTEPGRRILIDAVPRTLGRDTARDIVVVDKDVSRLHLAVSLDQGKIVIEDRNSTNGTFIDGERVSTAVLTEGSLLQVGTHVLRLERRSKIEVQRSEELARDLEKASRYVRSLLPAPLSDGPVRTDWSFQPSAQLGGDVFGYQWLDADTFVIYLIDVSGHGAGAAMHSVSVLNVLRQGALPNRDLREPAEVLTGLNAMFQMERHDGMFFTMWYGVYHLGTRTLRYACAGHHPGYLVAADRTSAQPLRTTGLMIGASPGARYVTDQTVVPAAGTLYLFSDGAFEIVARDGRQWRLGDFVPLLLGTAVPGVPESHRLRHAVEAAANPGPFEDDFSVLVVTLP